MWSAACGQAAEDLELLSSRHLPRRRREAPLELGVLARSFLQMRRAGPRALLGLGLERVLLAGVLCVTGVFVASDGVLWRRRAGSRSENSGRASGALAASRSISSSSSGAIGRCRASSLFSVVRVCGERRGRETKASGGFRL